MQSYITAYRYGDPRLLEVTEERNGPSGLRDDDDDDIVKTKVNSGTQN